MVNFYNHICNHLVSSFQDELEPPIIDIQKIGEELDHELQKADDWINANPSFDSTFARKNMKILTNNNATGVARRGISTSRQ